MGNFTIVVSYQRVRDSLDLLGQVAFQGAAHHQSSHDDHTCIDHLATNEAKLVSLVIEH